MAKKKTTKRASAAKPNKTAGEKRPAKKKSPATRDAPEATVATTATVENKRSGFAVVGVGASAGGLEVFRKFLVPMPSDCGMAFVLIQHLDPMHASHTAELLASHTNLPVVEASDGMAVEPNHVYVIPPGAYLSMSGNVLRLSEPAERRGVRVPIDFFFRSLAEDQQERAICVILSGTGSDGTLGLREVKAAGGIVLAQDPSTSPFDGMPRSAVSTGLVDYVLPPEQMSGVLTRYIRHWYVNGDTPPAAEQNRDDFNTILAVLRSRIKYDFSCYKKGTLWRRVQRRMGLRHIESLAEYAGVLRANSDEATALFKDLLIGVTNFFREPEAWSTLRDKVIRPLVARVGQAVGGAEADQRGPLRVWIPACASGEEAYTMAMLVIEEMQAAGTNQNVQIFASDIDHDAVSFARAGIYPENIVADVTAQRLRQFFIKGDHTYRINKELREAVVFAEQNLIGDPPFAKLDLISCRNLLIYLEPDAQQRIIAIFHFALREGGCLFLGNSETISGQVDLFEPVSKKWRMYRRVGTTRLDRMTFPIVAEQHPRHSPERSAAPAALLDASRLTQQLLLERYSPACALVNRKLDVVYLHGPTDAYLLLPAGEPTTDLLAMAREGLRVRLRTVVRQAMDAGGTVAATARVRRDGKYYPVQITAEPLLYPHKAEGLVLITFDADRAVHPTAEPPDALPARRHAPAATDDSGPQRQRRPSDEPEAENDAALLTHRVHEADQLVAQLEGDLGTSREEMRVLIEEMETTNEEMKAANEEATSINEELQSTNEELETSKEELQSLNEELTTVNNQLEAKVVETEAINNDLHNLLTSTDIATVFLDQRLCIKRFTPASRRLMRLIATDIGRPLSDVVLNFDDPDLPADIEDVLARLAPIEREVKIGDGDWYARRVLPYRTEDNRIEGVVITLVNITDRKLLHDVTQRRNVELARRVAEGAAQLASLDQVLRIAVKGRDDAESTARKGNEEFRALFESTAMGIAQIDASGRFLRVNPKFSAMLGYTPEEMLVRTVMEVTHPDDCDRGDASIAEFLRIAPRESGDDASPIAASSPGRKPTATGYGSTSDRAIEKRYVRRDGSFLCALERATLIRDASGRASAAILATLDLTERELERQLAKISEEERQRLGRELHDTLGQQITAIGLVATRLHEQLTADSSPQKDQAERLLDMIEEAQQQARGLFRGLLPLELGGAGLLIALADLTERTHSLYEIDCRFECDESIVIHDNVTATHLYRIAQEAVHNAVKHSGAGHIVVHLNDAAGITLAVCDDGVGIADSRGAGVGERTAPTGATCAGLAIMHHRARLIGGRLTLRAATPHGTILECTIPGEPDTRQQSTRK